jgi:SAM-dependent methyltransferase
VSVDVPYSPHDVSHVDLHASAESLPFEAGSFDFVLCTEVLEHCRDPNAVVKEIARVLKPRGCAFLTTPFMVGLHEDPHDYVRFTRYGLKDLAEGTGLTVEFIRPKGGYGAVLMLLAQYPFTKVWQFGQRRTGLPLYHPANPFLYFAVVLPQLVYVWFWRRLRGQHWKSQALSERLSRTTLGYVTVMQKGDAGAPGSD